MNIQSLVVVILRLTALDFLWQAAIRLTPEILSFLPAYRHSTLEDSRYLMVVPWLMLAALVIAAVALWTLAIPIAHLVVRGVPQDLSLGALTLADCYSVAFIGAGLLYACTHLPEVLNWAFYLTKMSRFHSDEHWQQQVKWYEVSQVVLTFIMGIVLLVNGRKWALALARKEATSGSPTASDNSTIKSAA